MAPGEKENWVGDQQAWELITGETMCERERERERESSKRREREREGDERQRERKRERQGKARWSREKSQTGK